MFSVGIDYFYRFEIVGFDSNQQLRRDLRKDNHGISCRWCVYIYIGPWEGYIYM